MKNENTGLTISADLRSIADAANKSFLDVLNPDFVRYLSDHETKVKTMVEQLLGHTKPLQFTIAEAARSLDFATAAALPSLTEYKTKFRELSGSIARAVDINSIGRLEILSAGLEESIKSVTILRGQLEPAMSGFAASFELADADYLSWQKELGADRYLECLKVWPQPLRDRVLGAELLSGGAPSGVLSGYKVVQEVTEEAEDYFFATLPEKLMLLDKNLVTMWEGSWSALKSRRPDYIRQSLISARELCMHVLHALAPTEQVEAWSMDPAYYANGKPTRAARMLYIASAVSIPSLGSYLRKEISACVELFDVLNKVHDPAPPFDDLHVQLILRKVHSTICTMIEMKTKGGLLPLK